MPCFSPLASPAATIASLQKWGLYTKKSLGQHFLIDDGVIGRILRLADLQPQIPIVEIGPGIGTLTEALLKAGGQVLAVEIDQRFEPLLADLAERYPQQFNYLLTDALTLLSEDLPGRFDIVANLPYALAATIVLDAFQRYDGLETATGMVQREVAQRIMAQPNTKAYGAFTVKLALLAEVRGSFAVSPSSFLPAPRVDSTVISLKRLTGDKTLAAGEQQTNHLRWEFARQIIDAAFAERRKTLRNSLRSNLNGQPAVAGSLPDTPADAEQKPKVFSTEIIDSALALAGVAGGRRAESLSVQEFVELQLAFQAFFR
ncbi:MAG: 16S rRNA (adenine(1518)-N(6)/adenine(1519)-N(6))-dimethyltransferase RsmA [Coriobacteriales bacterium]|jgi:16S rRNA (adenine1518-N6/adenine1519-N6)-dimethyltransferase|nr:16S rRNA (adenine(1518)-N(6)/adenine(1519)-N(6))-dimethyltransferase RsmA [Coriobacteriales bacterium]